MSEHEASVSDGITYENSPQYRCPKRGGVMCIPGPSRHHGECCSVTPNRQLNFSVTQRDTHHWDVYTKFGRAFRIRGEPGNVWIFDERMVKPDEFNPEAKNYKFNSVGMAMAFIAEELMHVREVPVT